MSYQNGMAAINLQDSDKVPRTEYSADFHWDLVARVTGRPVSCTASRQVQQQASAQFMRQWDYGMVWNVCIMADQFGDVRNDMGHAVFAQGGGDFRQKSLSAFADEQDVLSFDPFNALGVRDTAALVDFFNADYDAKCAHVADTVNMTGIYISLMSGLIDLFGWDLLLRSAGEDADGFGAVANRYTQWIVQYFEALALCKSPVVMVHDDIVWGEGGFMPHAWYKQYIFANYETLLHPLHKAGKKILYTSDGNYTQYIDDIAQCGVHGFVLEPTTDMALVARKYGKTHCFVGNADTRVLLYGTKEDIDREVSRCMKIGKDCAGFIMAVGNHIPPNTPVDNAQYYNEAYEKYARR